MKSVVSALLVFGLTGVLAESQAASKVQCHLTMCYCQAADGARIRGTETALRNRKHMNCECAVQQYDDQRSGLIGRLRACDSMGNYKNVQCTGSSCHCSDEFGKQIGTSTTDIGDFSDLACPLSAAQEAAEQRCPFVRLAALERHPNSMVPTCDGLDYAPVQRIGATEFCSSKDGIAIGYSTRTSLGKKNCKCAVDTYEQTGEVGMNNACDMLGNYEFKVCDGATCRCVDSHGAPTGDSFSLAEYDSKNCVVNHRARRIVGPCTLATYKAQQGNPDAAVPDCDEVGFFKPVQQADDMLYCSSHKGENLGYNSPLSSIGEKNCACAVEANEYKQKHIIGKMFHCDELGNYSHKQCTGSVCYCTDAFGKEIEGTARPISEYGLLACA